MKIALIILHADPARGGAERYTCDLAAALVGNGHEVSLLASSFAAVPASVPALVRSIKLDANGFTRVGRYLDFLNSLESHLQVERYDIVHAMLPVRGCDVYHPHAGIAAETIVAGRLKNRFNARRNRFAKVERELLDGGAPPIVLCLSNYVRQSLSRFYTLGADRTTTLFNAVDLQKFDGDSHRGGSGALIIAQDFERKGLHQAILAIAQVPGCRLVVVGGDDPRPYQKLASSTGVSDRVRFAGSTTDPRSFYQQADFFVLPTRHDPCSLVVLESLAMGVPVISTKQNGACEIMTDGVHGFVLDDPTDVPALAAAMQKMMDADRLKSMSEACLGLRPALSYQHHLQKLEDIYQRARRPK